MSKYWAKVNNGLVEKVIIANEDFFDTFVDDSAGTWIETKIDGSIRKNYAGISFSYDATRDAFIPPQPYLSWVLNETTCIFEAPITHPNDGKIYDWNETTTEWDEAT
tara:strand:+ start:73 stop:393 length:321 start_codon:yes stop_codon:yes gene_type:complete